MTADLPMSSSRQRENQDVVILVRIPAEITERADSRIVLPGE
jgi:hypothetical protein